MEAVGLAYSLVDHRPECGGPVSLNTLLLQDTVPSLFPLNPKMECNSPLACLPGSFPVLPRHTLNLCFLNTYWEHTPVSGCAPQVLCGFILAFNLLLRRPTTSPKPLGGLATGPCHPVTYWALSVFPSTWT